MYRNNIKIFYVLVTLVFLFQKYLNANTTIRIDYSSGIPIRKSAKTVKNALPVQVTRLIQWPEESSMKDFKKLSDKAGKELKNAKPNSIRWINKILHPSWLPEEKDYFENNIVFIQDEFDFIDVARVGWNKNGYRIEISQTYGIITVKLTPDKNDKYAKTISERNKLVKSICRQIFCNVWYRFGINKNKKQAKVKVTEIAEKISKYSFRPDFMLTFFDGVIGLPTTPEAEGLKYKSETREEQSKINREDKPEWENSRRSWGYWWRHVCWWHDQDGFGFFMLKIEAGPYVVHYNSKLNKSWFKIPKSEDKQEEYKKNS